MESQSDVLERLKNLKAASLHAFKARLHELLEAHPGGAVVFDADGTLWAHDVGCMVFDYCVEQERFHEAALPALQLALRSRGLDSPSTASSNDAARQLQKAFYQGALDERLTAEIQVWAYVGYSEDELRSLIQEALKAGGHESTLHEGILELAAWVRQQGGSSFIVSASPQWVVEESTRDLGFAPEHIAAGRANMAACSAGVMRIAPGMQSPLPYGPDKVVAGRRLIAERKWLAALGDSSFDLQMFAAAHLAGGIGAKASMLSGLAEMDHGFHLQPPL